MTQSLFTPYTSKQSLLGKTQTELAEKNGTARKQTHEQGDVFWWYNSIAPDKADLYRFRDGKVVWVSLYMSNKQSLTLDMLVNELGKPSFSADRFIGDNDSLRSKVVVWPEKGVACLLRGDDIHALVTRLEFFEGESLDKYFTNWGATYANHQSVNLLVTGTPTPDYREVQTSPAKITDTVVFESISKDLVVLCILIIFTSVFAFLLWKRRNSRYP